VAACWEEEALVAGEAVVASEAEAVLASEAERVGASEAVMAPKEVARRRKRWRHLLNPPAAEALGAARGVPNPPRNPPKAEVLMAEAEEEAGVLTAGGPELVGVELALPPKGEAAPDMPPPAGVCFALSTSRRSSSGHLVMYSGIAEMLLGPPFTSGAIPCKDIQRSMCM
jgi:hypothetical protein